MRQSEHVETLLGVLIASGLIGTLAGQQIGALFNFIGLLALLLIPSNALGGRFS